MPPNRTSHAPASSWKTRLWRSRKPECPTAVLGDRTPIPCPDSSGSSPTGQARQSPQRRTAPDVAPEASHPPTAAEETQSRGQSCGNCAKACHPVRKKGRINAKILPNPAKSDRLLAACRTHEIDGQILKQMESTSAFSATNFFLAGNLDSFVSTFC